MADNTENKGKKVIVGLALIIAGIFLMICLTAELIGSDVVETVIIPVQEQDGNLPRFQKIQQFEILIARQHPDERTFRAA